jgi:hypothetical protein
MIDINKLWSETPANSATTTASNAADFEPIPTGDYKVALHFTQVDLTGPVPKAKLRYKILEGDFSGRMLFSDYQLSDKGIPFLKKDLKTMGYTDNPKNLDELSKVLNGMVSKTLKVKAIQRTYPKKDGTQGVAHNVYVNAALAEASHVQAEQTATDDFGF